MTTESEQTEGAMHRGWEAVGRYISLAMQEVALELGGEELAKQIKLEAVSDEALPNPAALRTLEDLYPGSAERVIERLGELQTEAHESELAKSKTNSP